MNVAASRGASGPGAQSGRTGSVADAVRAVRPFLPGCLAPADDIDRIAAVTELLPGALSAYVGFESHLGDRPPHLDVAVRVGSTEPGRDVLAGTSRADGLRPVVASDPTWQRLGAVARDWADPAHDLHRSLLVVWLEFDIEAREPRGDQGRVAVPSVFLGPIGGIPSRLHADPLDRRSAADAYGWLTDGALPRLLGRPLPTSTADQLVRALDSQPAGAHVFQAGVMLAREPDAVRLCLAGMHPTELVPYLEGLGWAGDGPLLRELVAGLEGNVDGLGVDIDVADVVHGKVGLECYPSVGQPRSAPGWRRFLDRLVQRGLCTTEQQDALLAYPGFAPSAGGAVGGHLSAATALLGGRATSGYARVLNHVKVTYTPGRPLEAKAYLGAAHHWLTSRP